MARVIVLPRRSYAETLIIAAATLAMAMTLTMMWALASPVGAQGSEPPPVNTEALTDGDSSVGNILPRPNSGQAPDSPNDPGGWQQYLVFALIGLGLLAIVVLATRDSRRIRRAQGRFP